MLVFGGNFILTRLVTIVWWFLVVEMVANGGAAIRAIAVVVGMRWMSGGEGRWCFEDKRREV